MQSKTRTKVSAVCKIWYLGLISFNKGKNFRKKLWRSVNLSNQGKNKISPSINLLQWGHVCFSFGFFVDWKLSIDNTNEEVLKYIGSKQPKGALILLPLEMSAPSTAQCFHFHGDFLFCPTAKFHFHNFTEKRGEKWYDHYILENQISKACIAVNPEDDTITVKVPFLTNVRPSCERQTSNEKIQINELCLWWISCLTISENICEDCCWQCL